MQVLLSAAMRSFTDAAFIFVASHYLTRKKILLKWSHVVSLSSFVIVLFFVRINGSTLPHGYVVFLLFYFLMGMIVLKVVHAYQLSKNFLLGTILFSLRMMVEIPFYLLNLLELATSNLLFVFITQATIFVMTIFICRKFSLYKLFNIMQRNVLPNLLLRQMILTLTFTLLAYLVVADPNERNALFLFYFYFSILIIGLGLIPMTKRLYRKSIAEMISVHELHNALLSTGIAIRELNQIEDVVAKFDELSLQFGIDLSTVDFEKRAIDGMKGQILAFIELKKSQHQTKIEVISDIGYYKDHQFIDFQQILHWLGSLLDNALEAAVKAPIELRLVVTSSRVVISVSNDCASLELEGFEELFEEGYSTKGDGRGLGLYHLKQTVSKLGGRVICSEECNEAGEQYLTIEIVFK